MKGKRVTYNVPGHSHALNFSCYRRLPLFCDDALKRIFLDALDDARKRWKFQVWAYCIMPEHVHLVVWPTEKVYRMDKILSGIKKRAATRAMAWLRSNRPHIVPRLRVEERSGVVRYRFWQEGPGYDRNLFRRKAIWEQIDYIHGNPVARGLAETPTDWPWSSARWYKRITPVEFEVDGCQVLRPQALKGICHMELLDWGEMGPWANPKG